MPDIFTKAKRSEVKSRIRSRGSEFIEVEVFAAEAEVFDDAARHVAGMPGKRDEAVGTKRVRVVPVAAGGAEQFTTEVAKAAFELAAVPRRVLAHRSGGENELVAESGRNGAAGLQQRLEMKLRSLLKAQRGFAPVAAMGVTTRQQSRLGNPHPVFVAAELNFGDWNDHRGEA